MTAKNLVMHNSNASRYLVKTDQGWITATGHDWATFDIDEENAKTYRAREDAAKVAGKFDGKIYIIYTVHGVYHIQPE